MLAIFIAVSTALIDGGFGAALIQRKSVSKDEASSAFFFSVGTGILISAIFASLVPAISRFYEEPELTSLALGISPIFVVHGFSTTQTALLRRELKFDLLAKANVASMLVGGIVAISMAYVGFGAWSLVAQQLVSALSRTSIVWLGSTWRPYLHFRLWDLRNLFGFGSRMLVATILSQVGDSLYFVAIGKVFSAGTLGFYSRASLLQKMPTQGLSEVVSRVTFPVFALIQDSPQRLKKATRAALEALALVNFPMMIGLATMAEPVVSILFGQRWLPCVPYLQLLCFVGMLFPLHLVNINLLVGIGRSDIHLKLEMLKQSLTLMNVVVTSRFGVEAMIAGQFVISCIALSLNTIGAARFLGYGIVKQMSDVLPYLGASLLMGACVYLVGKLDLGPSPVLVALQFVVGLLSYITICWLFRLSAFVNGLNLLRSKLGSNFR